MTFLAIVEVGNRFRQVFAEEDVNDYKAFLTEQFKEQIKSIPENRHDELKRKFQKDSVRMVRNYAQKNERLTRDLIDYADGYLGGLSEEARKHTNETINTLYSLVMELLKSKNPVQMLRMAQMYNVGFFDKAMEEVEKQRKAEQGGIVDMDGNALTT